MNIPTHLNFRSLIGLLLLLAFTPLYATTYVVINVNDGGAGSLRQAMLDANADPATPHIIGFNIPGSGVHTIVLSSSLPVLTRDNITIDGYSQPGAVQGAIAARTLLIEVNAGNNPAISNILRIDASHIIIRGLILDNIADLVSAGIQSDYINMTLVSANRTDVWITGNYIGVDPAGSGIVSGGRGIDIEGDITGSNSSISGVIIGTNGDGTGDADEGNLISGAATAYYSSNAIDLAAIDNSRVAGNYIGIDRTGSRALQTAFNSSSIGINLDNTMNVLIGTNGDGISDAWERNVISGVGSPGIQIENNETGTSSRGPSRSPGNNSVCGNYIGTDITGLIGIGNDGRGIAMYASDGNTIGSADGNPLLRNVISGNGGSGVRIWESPTPSNPDTWYACDNNVIGGNYIGVGADSVTVLGNGVTQGGYGIDILGGDQNRIVQNIIANNAASGIVITGDKNPATDNTITGNSIFSNSGPGIDLGDDGVTPNNGLLSPPSPDAPNRLVNYPIITSASLLGGALTIAGFVGNAPGQSIFGNMTLEFFVANNDPDDQEGAVSTVDDTQEPHGEGQHYIGSGTTDANGNFNFIITGTGISGTTVITATATTQSGSTSEFGPNFNVPDLTPLPVHWLRFTCTAVNSQARLDWTSGSETNNKGFTIQRSADGGLWDSIGFVPSRAVSGNSSTPLNYVTYDSHPLKVNDFYRLKQTDLDGRSDYSEIRMVAFEGPASISIYPNPVRDELYLQTDDFDRIRTIRILDMNGRLLSVWGPATRNIDMQRLPVGSYIVRVEQPDGTLIDFKIIKI